MCVLSFCQTINIFTIFVLSKRHEASPNYYWATQSSLFPTLSYNQGTGILKIKSDETTQFLWKPIRSHSRCRWLGCRAGQHLEIPYIAGENGGAAFILVYITLSLLICIPIMLTEFSIGRHTRSNALRAFRRLSPRGYWNGAGYLGIATSTIILSFYAVIAGWALHFLKVAITGGFLNQNSEQIRYNFDNYIAQGTGSMFWTFLFIAFIAFIVMRGVEKGIEKFGKVVMPFMILLLIGLVINSMTLDGAKEGISFLLRPDFGKINGHVVLQALGQAFFR